jgi:hypothetical protein
MPRSKEPLRQAEHPHTNRVVADMQHQRPTQPSHPFHSPPDPPTPIPPNPHRQVLYELLAQVVVDAVDLVLPQMRRQTPTQGRAAGTVPAKRLLHNHPGPARPANGRAQPRGRRGCLMQGPEPRWESHPLPAPPGTGWMPEVHPSLDAPRPNTPSGPLQSAVRPRSLSTAPAERAGSQQRDSACQLNLRPWRAPCLAAAGRLHDSLTPPPQGRALGTAPSRHWPYP